ncbi:MAG: hypothetical protein O7C75_01795 [Verrucomicrobia bacterium]|nr:hypothetical protein [Verrucomicrobiota bacterium]
MSLLVFESETSAADFFRGYPFETIVTVPVNDAELADISLASAPAWLNVEDLGAGQIRLHGTPSLNGPISELVVLQSHEPSGGRSHLVTLYFGSEFEHWLKQENLMEESKDPSFEELEASPYHFHYAFGLNLVESLISNPLKMDVSNEGLALHYTVLKGRDDVSVFPKWSTDLKNWLDEPLALTNQTENESQVWRQYTVPSEILEQPSVFFNLHSSYKKLSEPSLQPLSIKIDATNFLPIAIEIPVPGETPEGWSFEVTTSSAAVSNFDPQVGSFTYTPDPNTTLESEAISYRAISNSGATVEGEVVFEFPKKLKVNLSINLDSALGDDSNTAIIEGKGFLHTQPISGQNNQIENLTILPGAYSLKVNSQNNRVSEPVLFNVLESGRVVVDIPTAPSSGTALGSLSEIPKKANVRDIEWSEFSFESVEVRDDYTFHFIWNQDVTVSGSEYSAFINQPPQITFPEEDVEAVTLAAAAQLQKEFKIVLDNEESAWSQEHASRLLNTLSKIPQNETPKKFSVWKLTSEFLPDDILIDDEGDVTIVWISDAAFVNAAPRLVEIDGVRGLWYSKKLHRTLVRYVTDYANDLDKVEYLLNERFGVSINVPDYHSLTSGITDEGPEAFQQFESLELLHIIDMFEEMPSGMHKIPELKYLVRRLTGHAHPIYPSAAAVAWVLETGYIEFMSSAFTANIEHTHRLMLHEKAHFIWGTLLSEETKNKWVEIGGWYEESPGVWRTSGTTEFLNAYSHGINPNEDFAESTAYFIMNPDKLKSRSLTKYEFIRDRIMKGNSYLSKIREDLTFEVFNLFPDYIYPGKVNGVEILVEGTPEEDKQITFEISLAKIDGAFDSAEYIYTRIFSEPFGPNGNTNFFDIYLYPVGGDDFNFRGHFTMSKYAKKGYWSPIQLTITDAVGNERHEGINQFSWMCYIDNPLEDTSAPVITPDSMELTLSDAIVHGRAVQKLSAKFKLTDDNAMTRTNPAFSRIISPTGVHMDSYGPVELIIESDGTFEYQAQADFIITEFFPSGVYHYRWITALDDALNSAFINLTDGIPGFEPVEIEINTTNPDTVVPELDLNRISVSGEPINPLSPDGETLVTIQYYVRDDLSGLGVVSFRLRDPQGIEHHYYHYHENFYTQYFDGDPIAWTLYKATVLLPKGSAPGIWGLSSISLTDKALNKVDHSFVEVVHFDVTGE